MLWSLFVSFLQIGLVSFGGGYAMIPLIGREAAAQGWLTDEAFAEVVAVAAMAPGPLATNCATLIGMKTAGIGGAAAATLGMILPSLLLVVSLSGVLFRLIGHRWMQTTFYGLKPVITGLILYAAVHFTLPYWSTQAFTWHTAGMLTIAAASLIALFKYKLHPVAVIILAGLMGIAFFQ